MDSNKKKRLENETRPKLFISKESRIEIFIKAAKRFDGKLSAVENLETGGG